MEDKMNWDLSAPEPSNRKDQDIKQDDSKLAGLKVCLGICGSIAAYRSPDIVRELRRHGASVHTYVSKSALNFVTKMALEWTSSNPVVSSLTADAEHLGGEIEFDFYIFAPATYSTINKMACGIADSPVTIAFSSALGLLESDRTKVFISPCMHGSMHNSILTESMKKLVDKGVKLIKPRQEDGKNKLPEAKNLIDEIILNI